MPNRQRQGAAFSRELEFTDALGLFFSQTRGGVEQSALAALVKRALYEATDRPEVLHARWVDAPTWRWATRVNLAPDVLVADDADRLALCVEAKSDGAAANWPLMASLRAATRRWRQRLDAAGLEEDTHTRELSARLLASHPRWDSMHATSTCQVGGIADHFHHGKLDKVDGEGQWRRAAVHQGDVYTSQCAFLPEDMTPTSGGLASVDFILLVPHAAAARRFADALESIDRWHVASVRDFIEHLEDAAGTLTGQEAVWLDELVDGTRGLYGDGWQSLPELAKAFHA